MREIPVGSAVAFIDDEDYDLVSRRKWYPFTPTCNPWLVYARASKTKDYQTTYIYMHNLIMGRVQIDHKDGNGLNNVRTNLREATHAQNLANSTSRRGSSRFKGVSWYKRRGKWVAYVNCTGEHYHLGYFDDEVEAARAYDEKAKELFGEFARLNLEVDSAIR